MAVTPDTGDAFLREVDDEYRRDRMRSFWSRYGRWVMVAIGAALLAVGAGLYWQSLREREADGRGAALMRAQETASKAEFARLADAPEPGYRALARLGEASVALKAGDSAGAIKLYDALAADTRIADPFRNFALVKSTQLQFDAMAPQAVIDRVRPLAQPGGPWFGSAGELTAMAYLKQGKPDLALPLFEALLSDQQTPPTIGLRVQQLLAALAPERLQRLAEQQRRRAAAAPAGVQK